MRSSVLLNDIKHISFVHAHGRTVHAFVTVPSTDASAPVVDVCSVDDHAEREESSAPRRTIDVLPGTLIHEKNRTWQFQQEPNRKNGANQDRGVLLLGDFTDGSRC